MATIARFQGGHMDGQDMRLDSRLPIQSYIEAAVSHPATLPHCTDCSLLIEAPTDHETYKRVASGYSGENHIIIYRLEE